MALGLARIALLLSFGLGRAALTDDDPVAVGLTFMAGSIDPRSGSIAWALTSHGISENLFTLNQEGEIVGQVAESVSWVSDYVWDVTLKTDYKFSDGTKVTATHVATCLSEMNTENDNAQASVGAMTVTATDDTTVRIETEFVTHIMDSVLAEWVFVVYLEDAQSAFGFLFTGPYAPKNFVDDASIELVPNEYYLCADQRPDITITKYGDGYELASAVEAGNVDIGFHLPVTELENLNDVDGVDVKSFEVGYNYMMWHNVGSSNSILSSDVRLREAVDLAIDRNDLSQALSGGTGTRSLFPDYTPYYVETGSMNADPDAAEDLLDAAGWVSASDGNRYKDGEMLSINLLAYAFRPGLGLMQPSIATSLRAVGFNVTVIMTGSDPAFDDDWSEVSSYMNDKTFDLLMWAQNVMPAGDPAWFLNNFFQSDGDNNIAGLSSSTVDGLIDELDGLSDHTARVAKSAEVTTAILDEMPVSILVTPSWHVGVSDRMASYEPWGSDYYVIRSDLFVVGAGCVDATGTADGTADGTDDVIETVSSAGRVSARVLIAMTIVATFALGW